MARRKKAVTELTQKEKDRLRMLDFLGELTDAEIEVAKKHKILRWDLWKKAQKVALLTGLLHYAGFKLAPVHGQSYPKNQKFLVKSYEDLESHKAKK